MTDDGTASSSAGLSAAELVALVQAAGGLDPVASQLAVGAEAWGLIQVWYAWQAGGGRFPAFGVPAVSGLFGVPVALDPGLDPYGWMMLDRDGRVMGSGRLG